MIPDMATQSCGKLYDLVIVADGTGYLCSYRLAALRIALPSIIALVRVTGVFADIAVLCYRDFGSSAKCVEWSGWESSPEVDLNKFVYSQGGDCSGDLPAAAKTAICELSENLHEGRKTLVIWYAYAPPHHDATESHEEIRACEVRSLENRGEVGKMCLDWVSACKLLAERECQVVSILQCNYRNYDCFFALLGHLTRGGAFTTNWRSDSEGNSRQVNEFIITFLLGWMGAKENPEFLDCYESGSVEDDLCKRITFKDKDLVYVKRMKDESWNCEGILPQSRFRDASNEVVHTEIIPSIRTLTEGMHRFENPIGDLDHLYALVDETVLFHELMELMATDVTEIYRNAVFGNLWRLVCNRLKWDRRVELHTATRRAIGKQLYDSDSRAMLKQWLEINYDSAGEINRLIDGVDERDIFPAVCIDTAKTGDETFRWNREELLEIERNCLPRVLEKMKRILRNVVYLPSKVDVPMHLDTRSVVKLPLCLAEKKYQRVFWMVILHLVSPGLLLGSRGGALLAVLSLRFKIPFLKTQARECLKDWTGRWADLRVGENWSMGCLRLLLRVDKRERRIQNPSKKDAEDRLSDTEDGEDRGILAKFERSLFSKIYYYKLTELNMRSELTARVPFTPNKTYGYLAKTALCKICNVERSVTIMSAGNICGVCADPVEDPTEHRMRVASGSDAADGITSKACWVECASRTCRAQYVVYNVEKLKIRAKCWYCRQNGNHGPAPWVECTSCTNRVIWPKEYREDESSTEPFRCGFCIEGRSPTVEEIVTAKGLTEENSKAWILGEKGAAVHGLLKGYGRTIHGTVTAHTMEVMETIEILPRTNKKPLVHKSKPVRNSEEIKDQLRSWASKGWVENGMCTLCAKSNVRRTKLLRACGRRGCNHMVDVDCMSEWYGMNRRGAILNLNALNCPFCRRSPTGKTLKKYSMGVNSVKGLSEAIRQDSKWIFGWCRRCGFAKKVAERVCADTAPLPELRNWVCESCRNLMDTKECPGCGTMTQKTSGCNHITCPVDECGTEWCFVCRFQKADASDRVSAVYDHMREVHGGYYGADADHQMDPDAAYDSDDNFF